MAKPKTILYFHQSSELYGSDKTLLSLVSGLDKALYNPIVVLPREGSLSCAMHSAGVKTIILPLTILGRSSLGLHGIMLLPMNLIRSIQSINRALRGIPIDWVQSNTLAVLSGAAWAKMKGIPHVWHVHEIVVRPTWIAWLLAMALRCLADKVVCNSIATKRWLLEYQPRLCVRATVIWNGLDRKDPILGEVAHHLRRDLKLKDDDVLVVLMGRINRLKGQGLLLDAAQLLNLRGISNAHYLLVGDPPPGQNHFRELLLSRIAASPIQKHVTLMDFRNDIWNVWDACDIAVVPSTEPESFGMVAVEAMAAKKPVVAAAHGGLLEIVVHGETGLLFEPCHAEALANALEELIKDPCKRLAYGQQGEIRAKALFSLKQYVRSFEDLYRDLCL